MTSFKKPPFSRLVFYLINNDNTVQGAILGFIFSNKFGFTNFTYSKQDIIAIIFGIVGLLGVTYLAFHMEAQKRREKEEK